MELCPVTLVSRIGTFKNLTEGAGAFARLTGVQQAPVTRGTKMGFIRNALRFGSTDDGSGKPLDSELAHYADAFGRDEGVDDLREMVIKSWETGQKIEMPDAIYGPTHWKGEGSFHTRPFPYYFFLAGFVRLQKCDSILEIGTHYGGSARAMQRGILDSAPGNIITVDVTDLNPELRKTPGIVKLTGDANSESIIKRIVLAARGKPIDLLYVDADHRFGATITNLGLYCFLLRPRFVIIDDILLNDEMRAMWNTIRSSYPRNAVNCVDIVPAIRSEKVGFGLLKLPSSIDQDNWACS
jgi:cephalosporin hydroxylase